MLDVHGSRWLRNRFGEAGGSGVCLVLIFTEWFEICYYGQIACAFKFDSPYLRTTESTSSRQPTVSASTANLAELRLDPRHQCVSEIEVG